MKQCVFIGGKQIGKNCLDLLLKYNIKPVLVIGNKDDVGIDGPIHESVIKFAQKSDIDTSKNKRVKDPEIIELIKKIKPEIIFSIGGMQIIPKEVLNIPKLGVLNIHPALLPKYRGRYSTVHAIFNGEKETGVTIHWMDEGIDTGPIIMQKSYKIEENDTAKEVYDNFTKIGTELFEKFLTIWASEEKIKSTPQDKSNASYYPKGLPNDGKIDWSWSGEQIRNFIRALTFEPYPPVDFNLGNKKMVIIDKKYFNNFE
jgi:methionyl-tRNA formyltransferase